MNVLVQHPSKIWSFEVCEKWEKQNYLGTYFTESFKNVKKKGLLGGQKNI